MAIAVRGKDKVLGAFKKQRDVYWKVYLSSNMKNPVAQNFDIDTWNKSGELLEDVLDYIDTDNVYTLEIYKKQSDKKYTSPEMAFDFTLNTSTPINGNNHKTEDTIKKHIDNDSYRNEIELIQQKAKVEVELAIYKSEAERLREERLTLKSEIEDLKRENERLTEELEEYEEEEEDGKVNGENTTLMDALAHVIKENGGAIIENFTTKKDGKGKLEGEVEKPINGVINGTDPPKKNELPEMHEILERLEKCTPHLRWYLHKLMLIGEQKPGTYKTLLKKVEDF